MPLTQRAASCALADFASLATIIGAPLALLALIVGVATLRSGARAARFQHMHSLFKDYLRLQFEYSQAALQPGVDATALRKKLGSFKMYTLEEMYIWLRKERGLNLRWLWSPFRRRYIDGWQATIDWYLDDRSDEDFDDLAKAVACYGSGFLELVGRSQARRKGQAFAPVTASGLPTAHAAVGSPSSGESSSPDTMEAKPRGA
jgi:hypothetical protein